MNFDRFGFKARDFKNKNWLIATLKSGNGTAFEVEWNFETNKEPVFPTAWIKPETICQCTGLKDSEGNLIYENDYIKITGKEGNIEKALVRYDESAMEYVLIFNKSELPFRFVLMWLEKGKKCYVIGNKFDSEVENG